MAIYVPEAGTVTFHLIRDRANFDLISGKQIGNPNLYTPGEEIVPEEGLMKGHGTYVQDGVIFSSVAGIVERTNKLISVRPLKSRYIGEVGDVVVGRILEIQQKRWTVDVNARLNAFLLLSSVNLPGGELRRRGAEDEQAMGRYLREGDLISAEVQSIYEDGSLSLYTRSLRYGKLGQGVMLKVPSSLIPRRKTHFHNLTCGVSLILGTNGYIWISPTSLAEVDEGAAGGFSSDIENCIEKVEREAVVRVRNVILALSKSKIPLYDTSITFAFEESDKYKTVELLKQEIIFDIASLTQNRLNMLDEFDV